MDKGSCFQGGKVYDSKFGVTCHWCRQKTLAESVTCTSGSCGARRMPISFCKSCLLNRHGEDWQTARDSGTWVCPPCRGSCGPGCTLCCNCGPCRCCASMLADMSYSKFVSNGLRCTDGLTSHAESASKVSIGRAGRGMACNPLVKSRARQWQMASTTCTTGWCTRPQRRRQK